MRTQMPQTKQHGSRGCERGSKERERHLGEPRGPVLSDGEMAKIKVKRSGEREGRTPSRERVRERDRDGGRRTERERSKETETETETERKKHMKTRRLSGVLVDADSGSQTC